VLSVHGWESHIIIAEEGFVKGYNQKNARYGKKGKISHYRGGTVKNPGVITKNKDTAPPHAERRACKSRKPID